MNLIQLLPQYIISHTWKTMYLFLLQWGSDWYVLWYRDDNCLFGIQVRHKDINESCYLLNETLKRTDLRELSSDIKDIPKTEWLTKEYEDMVDLIFTKLH